MKLRNQLQQKQTLKQVIHPKMIQLFKVLNASYSELVDQITQEAEHNVLLEIRQNDQLLKKNPNSNSTEHDISDFSQAQENNSLYDFLNKQLEYISISDAQKKLVKALITHLNDQGFLDDYPSLSKTLCEQFNVSSSAIRNALSTLQDFEPDGVGARSLKECLSIQLEHFSLENEELHNTIQTVINSHLEDLASNKLEKIAEKLDIPVEGVEAIASFIKTNLNPNPGINFTSEKYNQHITPSFTVSFNNDSLQITNLEKRDGIKISLSDQYLQLLNDPNTDAETKKFLQEKFDRAKELTENIEKRHQMIDSLVQYICNKQLLYLKEGPDFLVPLLQKEVSKELSINPSSVSRILSSKFCRTPQGVIALKVLCPRRYFGKTKESFEAFLSHYFFKYPKYSDNKIANLLKEKGLKISRRSVTKYRQKLQIPSSYFAGREENEPNANLSAE